MSDLFRPKWTTWRLMLHQISVRVHKSPYLLAGDACSAALPACDSGSRPGSRTLSRSPPLISPARSNPKCAQAENHWGLAWGGWLESTQ